MALRLLDGFDNTTTTDLTSNGKWSVGAGNPAISVLGRFAPGCVAFNASASIARAFDAQGTWVIGFAFRYDTAVNSTNPFVLWSDAGTTQISLYVDASQHIRCYRGSSGGTLLGTSTPALALNTWYFLEWKFVLSNTVGTVDVLVNGVSWLALTGQDTTATANNTADRVVIGATVSTLYIDDVYILDGTGSTNNTLIGDQRVVSLLPSAAGNYAQW